MVEYYTLIINRQVVNTMENDDKIRQNLIDAGCDSDTITDFFNFEDSDSIPKQLKLLQIHRKKLLEGLHKYQNEIDCLDYLIIQIEKQKTDGLFNTGRR